MTVFSTQARAAGVLALCMLFAAFAAPAAQAVPPGGAQYGVGIPTPEGPRTPTGDPVEEDRNLPRSSEDAIDELGGQGSDGGQPTSPDRAATPGNQDGAPATAEERRQLAVVGSSTQLGAPDSKDRSGGVPVAAADSDEGFLSAAVGAMGGIPLLLVLLAAVAALGIAARRRATSGRSGPPGA